MKYTSDMQEADSKQAGLKWNSRCYLPFYKTDTATFNLFFPN